MARCGMVGDRDYGKCSGKFECCSADGYCGTSEGFCYSSGGCQPDYGMCRCGNEKGDICAEGYCCSGKGYCGTTNEFCSVDKGCQLEFGTCNETEYTCALVKERLGIKDGMEDYFKCEENENGLAKTL